MKTPVQNSRGRMIFTGRFPRSSFNGWTESQDGRAILERIGNERRFALFGRTAAARRRVWRQLSRTVRTRNVISLVQREIDAGLERLDPIVYAHDLPRVGVDLRRLVVVPRLFVNGEAYRGLYTAVQAEPAFTSLEGGESLTEWFVITVVEAMDAAIASARPSPHSPLPATSSWIVVGVDERFEWRVPFQGPAWPGHYYVMELTAQPVTRAVRKAVDEAIAGFEKSLPSLPRARRTEIVRQAAMSLQQLLARDGRRVVSL
jgi:hypothetical protein